MNTKSLFSNLLLVFSIMFMLCSWCLAETPGIAYRLSWQQPHAHLLKVELTVTDLDTTSLEVRIPAWRPGRYIIQNYAKNVIDFEVTDGKGNPLPFVKIDKSGWRVTKTRSQNVCVKYRYYARHLDAGSSYLDDSEAYINPITCLMYVAGQQMQPVSLAIEKPADWKIAAALELDQSLGAFVSPNYHELVDAPILISPSFKLLSFTVDGVNYDLALQGEGNFDSTQVVEDVRKIVVEQIAIMQEMPCKYYLFMYHLLPYRFGHGVEHKNATSIVVGPADFDNERFYNGFLGVTSHEFFHLWNVERIRPEAIYLPDYSKENYTTTMWIYEGLTSYFGGLTLVRTQLTKKKKYLENWASTIRRFQNTYGRKVMSVDMVSWDSWTKSMGHAPPNTYYSFYTKGNILGLLLDLEIRHRTKNKKSLNDVMRFLYRNYAKKDRGVPENGMQLAVEQVAGSRFETFFADYVHGTAEIDYNRFLNHAGLELQLTQNEKGPGVYLGISTSGDEKETKIRNVVPDSPAFAAGLDLGDILLAIDGRRAHQSNLELLLKNYQPGDTVQVTVFRRHRLRHFDVPLAEAQPDKYEINELEKPSKLQAAIRKSWLNEQKEDLEETGKK
ncbi:MAG: M61 family metallopeptidase [bacterium]